MATLFQKIKKALGFVPEATCYRIEQKTGEPVKVTYDAAKPVEEEVAIDNNDDAIDLAAMTKTELLDYAKSVGAKVSSKMKKQEIVDAINEVI